MSSDSSTGHDADADADGTSPEGAPSLAGGAHTDGAAAEGAPSASRSQRRQGLRWPGRFEWKILAAVFIVAMLPLVTTGYFLSRTLTTVGDVESRHRQDVMDSLRAALDAYRTYFAQEKEIFRERAEFIAQSKVLRAADVSDAPNLLRARILEGDRVVDEWSVEPEALRRAREAPPNLVELPPAPGSHAARALELTFGIDRQTYANFLSLRQAVEEERDLDRVLPILLPGVFRALSFNLFVSLIAATAIGLLVARRATRRVAVLRQAAARVATGDLAVRIAPRGRDELDDLGRAFDRMVEELGEARSRVEYLQKVSAWQEVARRLAHEIKNPLTPIQLAIQELRSQYRGDDPAYRSRLETASEVLHDEIAVIRRLVDDFSAFAKLPKVDPQPVDLGALVADFARAHPEWQDLLRIETPAQPVWALCDRMLIRRVLSNLVENALQAAAERPGGPTPQVVIRIRLADDPGPAAGTGARLRPNARIQVDDNGPGVPAARARRIFDPYFTTKESGTGLGLAIVRKIVLDHGGDVTVGVAEPPLHGARFTVELPNPTRP